MVVLSGIQPTGNFHIGNYLGALKQWKQLHDNSEYETFFSVVDLHALTVIKDKDVLEQCTLDAQKMFLAIGITDSLFVQSHIPHHTQLYWILSTLTPVGDLERMTQFKDKKAQGLDTNSGLFTYPILMAADILLYNTELVPVGEDQIQHIELTRTIARRFNSTYSQVFKEPKPMIIKQNARIMSLKDPTKKMSKSLGEAHYVGMLEPEQDIREKFQKATTDSDNKILYDPKSKPGVSNLLAIFSGFENISIEQAQQHFASLSYSALKQGVADSVIHNLQPIRETFLSLKPQDIEIAFTKGEQTAQDRAHQTLQQVCNSVGI